MKLSFAILVKDPSFYHSDMSFYAEPGEFIFFVGRNPNATNSG
jgi:beta-glucosidase